MMIPVLLLALAAPSHAAGFALDSASVESVVPSADALIASMREGTREERLAAVNRVSGLLAGFDSTGQLRVIQGLREQAESLSAPGEVRGKAFIVLGEQAAWLRDDFARREAISALLDALEATPGDSREGYRRYAIKGLWSAATYLPQDENLENRAANAFLTSVEAPDAYERVMALSGLDGLLRSRPRLASLNRAGMRLRSIVLEPAAASPSNFCGDGRRDADERGATLRLLADLAWASEDAAVRARVHDVMTGVAGLDSNPAIRRQAAIWSRTIRA